jgi:hypothetical protein
LKIIVKNDRVIGKVIG